jgi:site-specific recombinase XerD
MQDAKELFLLDCRSRSLSPETLIVNRRVLDQFFDHCKATALADITAVHIKQYLTQKAEANSKSTARRYYTALKSFFKFAVDEGLIKANPMERVTTPKEPTPIIKPLTSDQLSAIVKEANGKTFVDVRNRLILLLLIDCGLRCSELIHLEVEDIDLDNGLLTVNHGKGDRARSCPIGSVTAKALRQYLIRRGTPNTSTLIINTLGEPTRRENVLHIVQAAGKKAGVPRAYPHLLRHSMAVEFLRNGGNAFAIQRILGHSTLTMTKRYCELADSDVVNQHRLYSPCDNLKTSERTGRKRLR